MDFSADSLKKWTICLFFVLMIVAVVLTLRNRNIWDHEVADRQQQNPSVAAPAEKDTP